MRHCSIYACPRAHENICCADCKEDCPNRCKNGPERCKCTTESVSKAKTIIRERLPKKPVSDRQQIFCYLDAGCDVNFIEAKGFRRKYIFHIRHDWRVEREKKPVRKTDLVIGLMMSGMSDLEILAYGWDAKIVEACRKRVDAGET